MRARLSSDARLTAAALKAAVPDLQNRVVTTTQRFGMLLQTRVRANASGRPGPRRQTGDYRRSITVEHGTTDAGAPYAEVGTNLPQGRRLEYGFWGMTDSLGRLFRQPPYPHFGPAFDTTEPQYLAALEKDAATVVRGIGEAGA